MSERPMGLADPKFCDPYVDVDEWRDEPVRHRYVHGGFEGTECRFSLYFPERGATRDGSSSRSNRYPAASTAATGRHDARLHRVLGRERGVLRGVEPRPAPPRTAGRGLDHRRVPRERGAVATYSRVSPPRCTASTALSATCSEGAAAGTARWRASRTPAACGTARCPTSTGRR